MVREVMELLAPQPDHRVLDLTVGAGGHASALLEALGEGGVLVGVDRDLEILAVARERLSDPRVHLVHGAFGDVVPLKEKLPEAAFDAVLLDLGVSSLQLDRPERGFSFRFEGPLDMRMDPTSGRSAAELVNESSVSQLADWIREFGEEKQAKRIAQALADARAVQPLETTAQLRAVIHGVVGRGSRDRIDPATRTFQALRIAVNGELDQLDGFLARLELLLGEGGRLAVISYHSLEDRRVKNTFRTLSKEGDFELLTRKALRPSADEIQDNPRARSARLRGLRRRTREESA